MKSLARFQQLTFPESSPPAPPSVSLSGLMDHTPKPPPPLTPSPPFSETATQISSTAERHLPSSVQTPQSSLPLPAPYTLRPEQPHTSGDLLGSSQFTLHNQPSSSSSPSPESECCGGFLDCQELVEEEEEVGNDQVQLPGRLSDMRSTSERPSYNSGNTLNKSFPF